MTKAERREKKKGKRFKPVNKGTFQNELHFRNLSRGMKRRHEKDR